mgnify:CR=1 FL=1
MEDLRIKNRSEISVEDTWAIEDIYISEQAWEKDLLSLEEDKEILERYGLIVYTIENIDFQKLK